MSPQQKKGRGRVASSQVSLTIQWRGSRRLRTRIGRKELEVRTRPVRGRSDHIFQDQEGPGESWHLFELKMSGRSSRVAVRCPCRRMVWTSTVSLSNRRTLSPVHIKTATSRAAIASPVGVINLPRGGTFNLRRKHMSEAAQERRMILIRLWSPKKRRMSLARARLDTVKKKLMISWLPHDVGIVNFKLS